MFVVRKILRMNINSHFLPMSKIKIIHLTSTVVNAKKLKKWMIKFAKMKLE